MKTRLLAFPFAVVVVAYGVVSACSDPTIDDYCMDIPKGGCPGEDGTNCEDTTCAAIYSHSSSCVWTFVQSCPNYKPPHDAGPPDGSRDAAPDGQLRDAHLRDAGFVLPPGAAGGPGCLDLESPDCPLDLALQCDDCCGCQDLYVCVDGGWNEWGECGDGGGILQDP